MHMGMNRLISWFVTYTNLGPFLNLLQVLAYVQKSLNIFIDWRLFKMVELNYTLISEITFHSSLILVNPVEIYAVIDILMFQ